MALTPYALILFSGVLWGSTFSLTLIATEGGTHPMILAMCQAVISTVLFLIISLAMRSPVFRWRNFRHYAILAAIGIVIPNLLYYFAAPHLNAGILSITVSTVPMLTYALMCVLRYERFEFKRGFGVFLGLLAICLLVIPDQGLESLNANLWILVVLICAACYAVENVYISEGVEHSINIMELLCGANMVAAAVLVPLLKIQGHTIPDGWLQSDAAWAIVGIACTSMAAYSAFFYTIKTAGPVFASQCAYIVTFAGVLWGILLFDEAHSIWVWLSIAVVIVGLMLVTPTSKIMDKLFDELS